MSTFQIEGSTRTFETGTGGVTKGRRVNYETDGVVEHAIASEAGIGVALRTEAEGDPVAVRLWNAPGTFQLEASGVITRGQQIEGAADGKVAAIGGAGLDLPYINLSGATAADGDVFEAGRLGT